MPEEENTRPEDSDSNEEQEDQAIREKTQDRIARFIAEHSKITQERLLELMLDSTQLVKDVGTMLEGADAVREGLIDEVGGISQAFAKLHEMIEERRKNL